MKTRIFTLLLFCMATSFVLAKSPFYIVDGCLGVDPKCLPLEEDIARMTSVEPEEAVRIYGNRASDGAVIIETYAHLGIEPPVSAAPAQTQSHEDSSPIGEWGYALLVLGLIYFPIFFLSWTHERKIQAHLDPEFIPERHNADGYHTTPFKRWMFFFVMLCLFCVIMSIFSICILKDSDFFLVFILALGADWLFLLGVYVWVKRIIWNRHLTIDDMGIRGLCENPDKKWRDGAPRNVEFVFTWAQIEKIRKTTIGIGGYSTDALVIYHNTDVPNQVATIIPLRSISTLNVIDAIKFFSARNNKPKDFLG